MLALVALAAVVLLAPAVGGAQEGVVKIGVLDDMSGPYADNTGPGDLLAVRMAVADFGGAVLGKPIEVISADMQNKVDVGVGIARRWYEQDQVDLIIGIPHSAIALGVVKLAEQTNRLVMPTGAATAELTGKACSAHSVHWVYDTYGQGKTLANAIVKQGGDTWFFITVDYAFGHALEQNATEFVKAAGGKVLGSARHPLNNADFSSYLLQAQSSKAKVVVMANGGADITNAIKQANEFGLERGGQKVAALLIQYPEVRAIGLRDRAGAADGQLVLLGHDAGGARLQRPLRRREGHAAHHDPGRDLRRHPALPPGGEGGRHRRGQGGHGEDEGAADQRLHDEERPHPGRRPGDPRHVPHAGEDAGRVEGRVGPRQDRGHDSRASRRSARSPRVAARS